MTENPPASKVLWDPEHPGGVSVPAVKCLYTFLPMLYLGAMFPKLSLLSLYLRIFVGRTVQMWTYFAMSFVVACGIAFTFGGFFACQPVQYFWNRLVPGHCINLDRFYQINTPINIVADLIILIIPLPALWKLQAPKTRKVGLTIVFSMGGLGMLASIARWVVLMKYSAMVLAPLNTTIIVGWCLVEPAAYLIAACLPPCSSIAMLIAGDRHVRRMLGLSTRPGTARATRPRNSAFRLSVRPIAGFAQLESEVARSTSSPNPMEKNVAVTSEERLSEQETAQRELVGIDVRVKPTLTTTNWKRDSQFGKLGGPQRM